MCSICHKPERLVGKNCKNHKKKTHVLRQQSMSQGDKLNSQLKNYSKESKKSSLTVTLKSKDKIVKFSGNFGEVIAQLKAACPRGNFQQIMEVRHGC